MPNYQFRRAIPPFARASFGGKARLRKRCSSEEAGKIWLAKIEARIQAAKAGGELASVGVASTVTFRRAAAAWIDQLDVRPSTMAWYRLYLRARLNPAFGDLKLTAIGQAALAQYKVTR